MTPLKSTPTSDPDLHKAVGKVQEEHASMGERHRPRPGDARAAADEGLHGGRVVRGAVGGEVDQRSARRQESGHRVDRRDLQGLLPGEAGQQGGQPLGEHGLARARRPFEEQVVRPGRGDLHRRTGRDLADDVGEVVSLVLLGGAHAVHSGGRTRAGQAQAGQQRVRSSLLVRLLLGHRLVGQQRDELPQTADTEDGDVGHQRGLGGGALGHDHLLVPGVGGGQHRRQDAPDRTHPPVQAELPDHHDVGEHSGIDPFGGAEHRAGHGQVEAAAGLGHRGRAEPDRELLLRPLATGVFHFPDDVICSSTQGGARVERVARGVGSRSGAVGNTAHGRQLRSA